MLVHHLVDAVLKQHNELVERIDLPLQFDAVNEINRNRNFFLAQDIQVVVARH